MFGKVAQISMFKSKQPIVRCNNNNNGRKVNSKIDSSFKTFGDFSSFKQRNYSTHHHKEHQHHEFVRIIDDVDENNNLTGVVIIKLNRPDKVS